ncbi:uncharacterized protein MEPE_03248 [Melanopsichium pennsylvanicum]|uniref:Uncharacterized protein n=1 Tax=Melanopsichium pennsylvanicum TaxID=63383 RepID=A0AAJ5C5H5_9BASI|nr:uncharacterized protein MEPE_03248 [Melanopsichium pennsylvanicum]
MAGRGSAIKSNSESRRNRKNAFLMRCGWGLRANWILLPVDWMMVRVWDTTEDEYVSGTERCQYPTDIGLVQPRQVRKTMSFDAEAKARQLPRGL